MNKLPAQIEKAYAQDITTTGAHMLVGWMLQSATESPVVAEQLQRFRAYCERPDAGPTHKQAFRDLAAA